MLTDVAVIVLPGVAPFELGVLCEAWGIDRRANGVPLLEFAVCSPGGRTVPTSMGFDLDVHHDLTRTESADLVAIPAGDRHAALPPEVTDALHAAVSRGARVLSVCSGAFVLGEAGLLDGKRCTTHWMYTAELERRFPRAEVVPEVLYVDADPVITAAGSAAGLDACLHLWRKEYGAGVASMVARRMVVPPHRSGGQAQFIHAVVVEPEADTLRPVLAWAAEHLAEPLSVEVLAERALMSPRTFARRFRAEMGTTPHAWLTAQRLLRCEELLESTDWPVERIAAESGFGGAAALRHHFVRARGVSPQTYRRSFSRLAG